MLSAHQVAGKGGGGGGEGEEKGMRGGTIKVAHISLPCMYNAIIVSVSSHYITAILDDHS